jgi:NAD(P)-dependent dehydrogenase (short-subunit alcohol dehydrogenase family)
MSDNAEQVDASSGPMFPDLAGRTAVVTGAASGIGRAIATLLGQHQVRVLAVDKDKDRLASASNGVWRKLDCVPIDCDLGDDPEHDPMRFAEQLLISHGLIDLVVNNVGICTNTSWNETTLEQFDRVYRVNVRNPFFLTRRLIQSLIEKGRRGSVLFVSSLHDEFTSFRPQYGVTKASVATLTGELARAWAEYGIRVNAISPGWIMTVTNPNKAYETVKAERMKARVPLGRAGKPDEVARIAAVLLSDACSSYMTGANVRVDGGLAQFSWVRLDELSRNGGSETLSST